MNPELLERLTGARVRFFTTDSRAVDAIVCGEADHEVFYVREAIERRVLPTGKLHHRKLKRPDLTYFPIGTKFVKSWKVLRLAPPASEVVG